MASKIMRVCCTTYFGSTFFDTSSLMTPTYTSVQSVQKCGSCTLYTPARPDGSNRSRPTGCRCMRIITDSLMSESVLTPIVSAMNMLQIGSARIHPNTCISTAEMITPTEPSVSAKMCRNTPRIICELWDTSSPPPPP
uniref:Uncharacterized protein n=1 Tax=Anopheles atroparvus TaxID=41427 RepID=A0A182J2U7_ANOAO